MTEVKRAMAHCIRFDTWRDGWHGGWCAVHNDRWSSDFNHCDAVQRPQEALEGRRRWEDVLFPSYRSEPASGRSQRLQRPRWLDRAGKDLTGQVKD